MFHILIFLIPFCSQTLFSCVKKAAPHSTNLLQDACNKAVYPGDATALADLLKRSDFSITHKKVQSEKLQQTLRWYEDNKQKPPASLVQALRLLFPYSKS